MKLKILFIINPISGVGKKKIIPKLIEDYLDSMKFEHEILYTEYTGHGHILAKEAVERGVNIVCAIGGDGSVHDVGTALTDTDSVLAIIPSGSGNGYARHFSIPLRLKDAIFIINQMKIRKVDVGLLNDHQFLCAAGFGFDAYISECFSRYHARGLWGYIRLIIKEYFNYKEQVITIKIDEKEFETKNFMCSIANATEFGNGFCISPYSNVHDGKMEIVLLKKFPWYKAPFVAYKFFKGRPQTSRYVKISSFNDLELKIKTNIGHVDGEPIELEPNVKIGIKPLALNLIVGENYA
ncbi:MAG: diacylglycerol kinase family protein [Crocinitomicaceae bacterium]